MGPEAPESWRQMDSSLPSHIWKHLFKDTRGDFPSGPVVENLPFMWGMWVQSLGRELRAHKPWGQLPNGCQLLSLCTLGACAPQMEKGLSPRQRSCMPQRGPDTAKQINKSLVKNVKKIIVKAQELLAGLPWGLRAQGQSACVPVQGAQAPCWVRGDPTC